MPHVSRSVTTREVQKMLDEQVVSFLGETSIKARQRIFKELFTPTERMMIGKRIALLMLVLQNVPTLDISDKLKMSPSTVARFETFASGGKFKYTAIWLGQEKIRNAFMRALGYVLDIGFKPKRLSKVLDSQ